MSIIRTKTPVIINYAGQEMTPSPPRKCIIVDLDGTLCNNKHRQHHMIGEKKNWAAFFADMGKDSVVEEVRWLIKLVFEHTDLAVVLATGRPAQDAYQEMTSEWLATASVPFTMLMMRAADDNTSDSTCKQNMLKVLRGMGYEPILSIDDRPEVVAMWRANGVPVWQPDATDWFKQQTPETPLLQALEQIRYSAGRLGDSFEAQNVINYVGAVTQHVDGLMHTIREQRDEIERLRK